MEDAVFRLTLDRLATSSSTHIPAHEKEHQNLIILSLLEQQFTRQIKCIPTICKEVWHAPMKHQRNDVLWIGPIFVKPHPAEKEKWETTCGKAFVSLKPLEHAHVSFQFLYKIRNWLDTDSWSTRQKLQKPKHLFSPMALYLQGFLNNSYKQLYCELKIRAWRLGTLQQNNSAKRG